MRKLAALTLCLAVMLTTAMAQTEEIEKIRSLLEDNRVSAEYSFTYGGKLQCSGVITIQDPCFMAAGNGIEVYCDGSTRWTVDREAREVYVEAVAGPQDYLKYLADITDLKVEKLHKEPRKDTPELFSFDDKALDGTWVVTDLR